MLNYNMFSYLLQVFFSKKGGKFMNLKELNDLIERFGNVKFLEIKEELQKMGYACKIAGDKND